MRETLFNWLQPRIAGARVLDLFAGSGTTGAVASALGRRFLLVDANPDAVEVMRQRLPHARFLTTAPTASAPTPAPAASAPATSPASVSEMQETRPGIVSEMQEAPRDPDAAPQRSRAPR